VGDFEQILWTFLEDSLEFGLLKLVSHCEFQRLGSRRVSCLSEEVHPAHCRVVRVVVCDLPLEERVGKVVSRFNHLAAFEQP
jgi:hypothetical protein